MPSKDSSSSTSPSLIPLPNISNVLRIVRKSISINSQPTEQTFPELPDVLVWIRFALGFGYGIFLGFRDIKSGIMPLQAFNLITFVPVMYCRLYLGVPTGQFDSKIIFAGTFNALALALLLWIYHYTNQHENDEYKLSTLLVNVTASALSSSDHDETLDAFATQQPQVQMDPTAATADVGMEDSASANIGMEEQEF